MTRNIVKALVREQKSLHKPFDKHQLESKSNKLNNWSNNNKITNKKNIQIGGQQHYNKQSIRKVGTNHNTLLQKTQASHKVCILLYIFNILSSLDLSSSLKKKQWIRTLKIVIKVKSGITTIQNQQENNTILLHKKQKIKNWSLHDTIISYTPQKDDTKHTTKKQHWN